ncbi:MAG: hypothetical protein Q9214_000080 [Letrouitia sp. 1 TL-2023]
MYNTQRLTLYKDVHERLNFLCKDLIEVKEVSMDDLYTDYYVSFLHRTVKDFLMTKDMHQLLLQRATQDRTTGWNAYRSLCNTALPTAKSLPLLRGIGESSNSLFSPVDEFLFYAHEVEVEQKYTDTELLDQLDQVISSFASKADVDYQMNDHWTNARKYSRGTHLHTKTLQMDQNTFLGLAIQFGLNLYVKKKLEDNHNLLRTKRGRPYLDYAFRPNIKIPNSLPHLLEVIDIELVRTLLDKGADPNQKIPICDNISVWGIFLSYMIEMNDQSDSNTKDIWFQAAEIMIRKGADRKLRLRCKIESRPTAIIGRPNLKLLCPKPGIGDLAVSF